MTDGGAGPVAATPPAPAGAGALLEVRGLFKSFGGTQALAGVDLTVLAGEVHALVGQNGSGKSTLIKILSGYHGPDAGSMAVAGSTSACRCAREIPSATASPSSTRT